MKEFVYDNSFEGLFTAIFYAYTEKDSIITKNKDYLPSLVLIKIYHLYLSDIKETDTLVLNYLKLCYSYGASINLAKNNDIIILVNKYSRRVTYEAHRFTGFVRFKEITPLNFYASIEPDHNILPLLINHFTKRFSDQNFIIQDLKRNTAIIYNKKNVTIL